MNKEGEAFTRIAFQYLGYKTINDASQYHMPGHVLRNFAFRIWDACAAQEPTEEDVERVAKAICFAARGEWSITPVHIDERTRQFAESWWKNPPNKRMLEEKELAFEQAKAAIAAMRATV